MPTKSKKSNAPPMHTRITKAWYEHPIATLGAIASVVAILAAIGPVLLYAVHYFATHDELEAHKHSDANAALWNTVQANKTDKALIDNKAVALRNRVNDCNIARAKKQMSSLETQACNQYDVELGAAQEEFRVADKRLEAARTAAKDATKEK